MTDENRLTETRLGVDGKPKLFSRMSKEEYKSIVDAMPPNFDRAVKGLVNPSDEDSPPDDNCDR